MELKRLQYFLKVAEYLNFSRAAEALYVSQPALSYQIAELEQELGTQLFIRDRQKVQLSPAGMALLEPAQQMLSMADRLPDIVRSEAPASSGILRIGFDDTEDHFEGVGVTETLAEFAREHPGAEVMMRSAPFTECADQVIYGDLDLAFLIVRHREKLPPDLIGRPVYRSRLVMVIREDCPAKTCAEAVDQLELLILSAKPRGTSRILRALEKMDLEPRTRQISSIPEGFVYAQMGKGIMLLSEIYYKFHQYSGMKAIPIPMEAAELTHEVVWNRGTSNPLVRELLEKFPKI